MTVATVADQICQFFGGTYNSGLHAYATPTVTGLSLVRRSPPKEDNFADYIYGQAAGTMTGAQMYVWISDTSDHRVALPAIQGRRKVHYAVELHCFIWSQALFGEDCTDFMYALRDNVIAKIRTDPTLGTGGIENNAFQVGEGSEDGGGTIDTHMEQGNTDAQTTKAYLLISFEAHAYDVA